MTTYTPLQQQYIDSVDGQAHQSAVEIIGQLESLRTGHDRYEYVRRMNPSEFQAAWTVCTHTGQRFDGLIDELRGRNELLDEGRARKHA